LLTFYIEEIRSSKFKYDNIINYLKKIPNNTIFNNTLFGSNFDPSINTVNPKFNTYSSNLSSILHINIPDENNITSNLFKNSDIDINLNKSNTVSTSIYNYNSTASENDSYDPFNIFNENYIRNLGIVNRFIIRPAYETLKSNLENSISNNLNTFKLIYIIVLSVFISGILFVYLFLWRPFENKLNATVKIFNYIFILFFLYPFPNLKC